MLKYNSLKRIVLTFLSCLILSQHISATCAQENTWKLNLLWIGKIALSTIGTISLLSLIKGLFKTSSKNEQMRQLCEDTYTQMEIHQQAKNALEMNTLQRESQPDKINLDDTLRENCKVIHGLENLLESKRNSAILFSESEKMGHNICHHIANKLSIPVIEILCGDYLSSSLPTTDISAKFEKIRKFTLSKINNSPNADKHFMIIIKNMELLLDEEEDKDISHNTADLLQIDPSASEKKAAREMFKNQKKSIIASIKNEIMRESNKHILIIGISNNKPKTLFKAFSINSKEVEILRLEDDLR